MLLVSLFGGEADLPFSGDQRSLDRPLRLRFLDLVGWWRFHKILHNHGAEIVQANAADTLKFLVAVRLFFGLKAKLVYRNANLMSAFIDSKPKLFFNRFLLSRADMVISVSERCSDDLSGFFVIDRARLITIPIGIDRFEISYRDPGVPYPSSVIFLLHVGGFVPEKNHEGLIRIFTIIRKEKSNVRLRLIGTGPLLPKIQQIVNALGLSEVVEFLGVRKDVTSFMRQAQMLLLPSLIEGLPAVILEAMAAHCPVVAYDVGGIPEVVRHRETGMLVPLGDESMFVTSVFELLNDVLLKVTISNNGAALVADEFDNSRIALRFEEAYHSLVLPTDS